MKQNCPVCGKQHFGHCHKCPHDADVKDGKYADTAFNKTPCFGCRDCSQKESNHLVITAKQSAVEALADVPAPTHDELPAFDALDTINFLVQLWVEQPLAASFLLARMAFPSWSLAQIAKGIGTTKKRARNAGEYLDNQHPELRAVYRVYNARSDAQKERRRKEREAEDGPMSFKHVHTPVKVLSHR
jgi:hypothetical protein